MNVKDTIIWILNKIGFIIKKTMYLVLIIFSVGNLYSYKKGKRKGYSQKTKDVYSKVKKNFIREIPVKRAKYQ